MVARYPSLCSNPLPRLLGVGKRRIVSRGVSHVDTQRSRSHLTVEDLDLLAFKWTLLALGQRNLFGTLNGIGDRRHVLCMLQQFLPAASFSDEAHSGREDDFAPLPRLYRSRRKRLPLSHVLHMIHYGYIRVSRENEIAMHRVNRETAWYCFLRRAKTLRYRESTEDASGPRWMPRRSRISEQVRADIRQ